MIIIESYPLAVILCVITMLCWGSWANTQKLASRAWRFELFYWDFALGVFLLSLVLAFTAGSHGADGRSFLPDLHQAGGRWLGSAFFGGVILNLSNILFVAAIDIAGMAVAYPIGVGLALCLGVVTTYLATGLGNPLSLSLGVGAIVVAIVFDAVAYKRLTSSAHKTPVKGVVLSITAGVLMGFFYSFVAQSMGRIDPATHVLESGKLSPYTAMVFFSLGVFLSNFVWNSVLMIRPFSGKPIPFRDYFTKGDVRLHSIGLLGGIIWNVGMSFSILASHAAGPTLAYGLGQGATLVGALWGVFIWKEFKKAPPGTNKFLAIMFFFYLLGLGILIASKT
jgi:glucose uptake protein